LLPGRLLEGIQELPEKPQIEQLLAARGLTKEDKIGYNINLGFKRKSGKRKRRIMKSSLSIAKITRKIGMGMIIFYQKAISPLLPTSCRFYPSCSEYSRQAMEKYGLTKGCWLSLKRILKCHPFYPGGYDPV